MDDSNEINISTKLLEIHYHNHIYNVKEKKHPFLLQFKQLKYYYNTTKKFKNNLSKGYISQEGDINNLNPERSVAQNMYCLIDRKWLKKWKKHVGYKEIKNKIKKNRIERDLEDNDYKWISVIIDKNYKENFLNPLDNNIIYKGNEINPLADFKVIHKSSFNYFNIHSQSSDKDINERRYSISFFKDKYLIDLKNYMLFIAFKNINSKKYNEIIGEFVEIKEKKNKEKYQIEEIERRKKTIKWLFMIVLIKIYINGLRK